jgi:uncharacterized membrane protein YphA (DoxX/SURF4 family)
MKLLRNVWLHRLLALVVGLVFAYASLDKIWWPERFARIVYHYQVIGPNAVLPPWLPNLLAVVLPWVELLTGVALVVGLWRREAGLLTAVMLVVFIAAVGSTLVRGIDIENCGCFSLDAQGRAAGLKLILQDLALLAGALVVAFVRTEAASAEVKLAAARGARSPLWRCPTCGTVLQKGGQETWDLLGGDPGMVTGMATCGGCGALVDQAAVYRGVYDV